MKTSNPVILPIELVARRAQELGLKCQRVSYKKGLHPRRLFIEDRKCQAVSAPLYNATPKIEALSLYFPTTTWADFFIYVSNHTPTMFFIVPRGTVEKETGVCSPENWIFKYQDAWSLLSEEVSPDNLERRFQILNWKTGAIFSAAEKKGCRVEFIRRKNRHFPFFIQNRLLINGRKCQVMSASRVSKDPTAYESIVVNLNPPRDKWAEFLLFVVPFENGHSPVFIVPRERVPKKTTTTLTGGWFLDFANAWEPITSAIPGPAASSQQDSGSL